ncbi:MULTISPECIES: TIM44-like domain-containing protein [unclassified Breznakia]|uniref:TIM44-like domain-containing protein n=1 Tax=unclassified Breznakia TaxID=2623764 RepID=UPI00247356B4|nr:MULTISPECIES: TIM44-like domain-containing protein [unclassified Breznakia]MDH6368122.1 hypothetical protein [Breznakia sp. PH1-1]MDH6405211.1 hypothetical protein [Breznakia sp. PF1-11]MDH6412936.1 hypothetical protein [Breznakia sp. PFB1-11]MDH6415298.1 hypothetical protein [Breznakia sp. PFB1-14]MDH6417596.1 hypothetical protein [Breznakia sp. PFB1-4]
MRNKGKRVLLSLLMVFSVCILATASVHAEVGNTGGFDDGGGSDSGGSDWSSWDSDDDYSSSGGGSGEFTPFTAFAILFGVGVFTIVIINSRKPIPEATSSINEEQTIQDIQASDPEFSADEFKTWVATLYITLQEAWEAKNWHTVRPFESNALFNMHNKQMEEYIEKKITNKLDDQDVKSVTLASYRIDGDHEVLTVQVHASCTDYMVDDQSGNIISGDPNKVFDRKYRFEFIRKIGVKTSATADGLVPNQCPNCGAPIKVNSSGECEYCNSIITKGDYGWVLNVFKAW